MIILGRLARVYNTDVLLRLEMDEQEKLQLLVIE